MLTLEQAQVFLASLLDSPKHFDKEIPLDLQIDIAKLMVAACGDVRAQTLKEVEAIVMKYYQIG